MSCINYVQSVRSYPLPYDFPPGKAWAAISGGVVMNMIYMAQPETDDVSYGLFRQRSRAALAKDGAVWSGEVRGGRFVVDFETTDVRHTGECNTARVVD